jgi:hypothetical protein
MTRTDDAQASLDQAACLLLAVGCDEATDPRAAIYALSAADHLRSAGARLEPVSVDDVALAVADALRALASMPDEVFAERHVADAVDDAQESFAAVGG